MSDKNRYLRRFLPYYKPYLGLFLFDTLCAALTTGGDMVLPMLVRFITNTAREDLSRLTVRLLLEIGLVYVVLRLIDAAARYFMASYGHIMGARIETDMRSRLFSHLEQLSFTFFDNTKTGQIMARMTSDLQDVAEFAHHGPENVFIATLEFVVAFCVLVRIDPLLTVTVFALLPVMTAIVIAFNVKIRLQFRRQRVQTGEINARMEDTLLGIRVVKSFANEDLEQKKFERDNQKFLSIKQDTYKLLGQYNGLLKLVDGIMYITIVVLGGIALTKGRIDAGDLFAYVLYLNTLLAAIHLLVQFTEQFLRGMTGIERYFQLMDIQPDIADSPDARPITDVKGDIVFEHVTFSYKEDGTNVLKDLNLEIKSGEHVAVVGPSGSGKTTLCSLIPRFYEIDGGRILLDGTDIRRITLSSLRSQIGLVQQDVYLFGGTVLDNILYGKPGSSREEVVEAAKKAGADGFIRELKDGYDTYVGERGVKLSGGQKQRIAIARLFLKNPPVVILDEATSALDNESERLVQDSLDKLAKGRTTLTIAHRLTTVKDADRILVLSEEGIVEQGTHHELVEKKGAYWQLYRTYRELVDEGR